MGKRFTIRSLLILTLLVALFLAIPFRSARLQQQGREWVAAQRGHITFKYGFADDSDGPTMSWLPSLVVAWLGVDMFNPVHGVMLDCEPISDLAPISNLRSLQTLAINIEMAENIDFSPLESLPQLKELHFSKWSMLTERQLKELEALLPNVSIYAEGIRSSSDVP